MPYFIAGHPGSDLEAMIDLALFLKRTGYRPDKVQDFIPSPMDIATCMYYTGLDPMTGEAVYVARSVPRAAVAAGAVAILQAGELFRRSRGPDGGGPRGPDRRRAGVPDRGPSAQAGRRGPAGQERTAAAEWLASRRRRPSRPAAIARTARRFAVDSASLGPHFAVR